jgi:medium-chain acyl-[acyl-carrier-protein] hydrolase
MNAPTARSRPALRRFGPPRDTGSLLICLPYAGGSASLFRRWSAGLGARGIELAGVQLPGREDRIKEPAHTRMARLVADLAAELSALTSTPYSLYGHSMGALVAFELAHNVTRNGGAGPQRLIVGAQRAPHLLSSRAEKWQGDDDAFLRELRLLGGVPEDAFASPELLRLMLPTLRADFEVLATYEPAARGALNCPITVYGGTADACVPTADLADWGLHSRATTTVVTLPGDHFFPWQDTPGFLSSLCCHLQTEAYRSPPASVSGRSPASP